MMVPTMKQTLARKVCQPMAQSQPDVAASQLRTVRWLFELPTSAVA